MSEHLNIVGPMPLEETASLFGVEVDELVEALIEKGWAYHDENGRLHPTEHALREGFLAAPQ